MKFYIAVVSFLTEVPVLSQAFLRSARMQYRHTLSPVYAGPGFYQNLSKLSNFCSFLQCNKLIYHVTGSYRSKLTLSCAKLIQLQCQRSFPNKLRYLNVPKADVRHATGCIYQSSNLFHKCYCYCEANLKLISYVRLTGSYRSKLTLSQCIQL